MFYLVSKWIKIYWITQAIHLILVLKWMLKWTQTSLFLFSDGALWLWIYPTCYIFIIPLTPHLYSWYLYLSNTGRFILSFFIIQGFPQNITVARRVESRLWIYLRHSVVNLLSLVCFWNNNHKMLVALVFQKCDLPYLCCHHYWRYWEFCSDFNFIKWSQNRLLIEFTVIF